MPKEFMTFLADTDADEDDQVDNFVQVSEENPLPCVLISSDEE